MNKIKIEGINDSSVKIDQSKIEFNNYYSIEKDSRILIYYDLIPKPIQFILSKISLDDRFFHTLETLILSPRKLTIHNNNLFSRPFEFLSGSVSIVAIILTFFTIYKPEGIFEPYEIISIFLIFYLTLITFTFILMHYDLLYFGLFRDKSKPKITYKTRLSGVVYLSSLYWILYSIPLIIDLHFYPEEEIILSYKMISFLVFFLQLSIAKHILNTDTRKFIRFHKYLAWIFITLYITVILVIPLALSHYQLVES